MTQVEQVRRFNRLVTARIGALDEAYLGRDRPLGASRVLWEIADDGADLRELRARLGLDSGYLSRLVARLVDEGLVTVAADGTDQRVRRARPTERGRRERRLLDDRSDDLAASLLAPLGAQQRQRLVTAMA
ncbi:MAG TPA: helix-turn-helix domain-containing protein, partial [Nocardioides sp.]